LCQHGGTDSQQTLSVIVGVFIGGAITLHNAPEGLAMGVAFASGLEGVAFVLVSFATGIFPVAAGFAAGAMLAVVFREMIPSSHGHGHADAATAAFLIGFSLLIVVDQTLVV